MSHWSVGVAFIDIIIVEQSSDRLICRQHGPFLFPLLVHVENRGMDDTVVLLRSHRAVRMTQ